ncbi:tryptophan-rich sensory protein [Candidatus Parcubacteria bacterium]|nr:MAG: tryptophan-rich sensory protein [Candidatus Parcubacteria bacterium]
MENYAYYSELLKPAWAPPSWIFGPVWTVLYVLIIVSFGYVLVKYMKKEYKTSVFLPFFLNALFNVLFTPIQFGLQSNILATLDILLVLGTLIWAMKVIWPKARWVVFINIPYLLWVYFATILQITVTVLNW